MTSVSICVGLDFCCGRSTVQGSLRVSTSWRIQPAELRHVFHVPVPAGKQAPGTSRALWKALWVPAGQRAAVKRVGTTRAVRRHWARLEQRDLGEAHLQVLRRRWLPALAWVLQGRECLLRTPAAAAPGWRRPSRRRPVSPHLGRLQLLGWLS